MSRSLFAVAALCLVATVCAQTAVVQLTSYTDAACTTAPTILQSVATGVCNPTSTGGESRKMFCSADANTVYQVSYADATCTTAYSVSSTSTACGFSLNNAAQRCVNATLGPVAPVTPGNVDGWASSTNCRNSTKSGPNGFGPADSCSSTGANIKCSSSGFNTALCKTTGNMPPGMMSTSTGCSSDGQLRGQAYFTDAACATFGTAMVTESGCQAGSNVDNCGSGYLPALPAKGVASYASLTCADDYYNPSTAQFYADGCVASRKFSCSTVNGTMAGTLETYSDATNTGKCTTLVSTVTQAEGVCNNGKVYFCSYAPKPNSASAVASSFVAMIVAAFVALVAARSL